MEYENDSIEIIDEDEEMTAAEFWNLIAGEDGYVGDGVYVNNGVAYIG
jgi:hypothetical protein